VLQAPPESAGPFCICRNTGENCAAVFFGYARDVSAAPEEAAYNQAYGIRRGESILFVVPTGPEVMTIDPRSAYPVFRTGHQGHDRLVQLKHKYQCIQEDRS
jgi:hypothetical protein